MNLYERRAVVFTAQSKQHFYCRDAVCEFVLRRGYVPLHPFKAFDYFLNDRVDRDLIRRGNFNLVRVAEELWVFGQEIANGVGAEIIYAHSQGKPIRFFSISTRPEEIDEVPTRMVTLEVEEEYDQQRRNQLAEVLSHHNVALYGSQGR